MKEREVHPDGPVFGRRGCDCGREHPVLLPADPAPSTETLTLERLAERKARFLAAYREFVASYDDALDAARQQGAAEERAHSAWLAEALAIVRDALMETTEGKRLDGMALTASEVGRHALDVHRKRLASPPDAEPPAEAAERALADALLVWYDTTHGNRIGEHDHHCRAARWQSVPHPSGLLIQAGPNAGQPLMVGGEVATGEPCTCGWEGVARAVAARAAR